MKTEEKRSVATTIRLKPSIYTKLTNMCEKEDRKLTVVIERALTEYLKKQKV